MKQKYNNVTISMITKNEEKSIRKVISDLKKDVPGAEILIVDSSKDRTPIIARKLGVKVIRQCPPQGYGPAMIKALTTPKREIIVTLDCDSTYPVSIIPVLVYKINEGFDVVGTTRISKGKPRNMPWLNYITNKFFNMFASIIFFRSIQDIQTGMRAYRRELIHKIKWSTEGYVLPGLSMIKSGIKGNSFPIELLLKPMSLGYRCIEIPIDYRHRLGVSTLQKIDSFLWGFLRIINSRLISKKNCCYD